MLAGSRTRVDLYLPSGAVLLALVFESPGGAPRGSLRVFAASGETFAVLRKCISEPVVPGSEVDAAFERRLQDVVAESSTVEVGQLARTPRVSAVVAACQLVEARLPASVTLNDLSRHSGVAERTLEYGFKQVYDTTPLAFIRSQRLTRTRTELLRGVTFGSICVIARACGFMHMGQYSRDYRRLFGETPSMTRARGQSARTGAPA
jgi:transcriptional regulator GlxA family with amidase domain